MHLLRPPEPPLPPILLWRRTALLVHFHIHCHHHLLILKEEAPDQVEWILSMKFLKLSKGSWLRIILVIVVALVPPSTFGAMLMNSITATTTRHRRHHPVQDRYHPIPITTNNTITHDSKRTKAT